MTAIKQATVRLLCLFTLSIGAGSTLLAQAPPATRPATPQAYTTTADNGIEERLVELALNGPRMDAGLHQNKVNEYQLKAARNTWMNILALSLNYNDQSFSKNNGYNSTIVFPRYYFGLTIPLGTIFSRAQVRAAQEQVYISKDNQEELRRTIKADVLSKYRQFRAYNDLITAQSMMVNDVQATLAQTEDKFKKGITTLDIYNTAQRNRNDEIAKLINLQMERDLIKIDIERMIGTTLESVTSK